MKNRNSIGGGLPLYTRIFHIVDRLMFAVLCAAALYIPFRHSDRVTFTCAAVLLSVLAILIAADKRTDRKKKERRIEEIKERIRFEKLLLMSDTEIGQAFNEKNLCLIRKTEPDASDVLCALQTGASCILLNGNADRFTPLLKTHARQTRMLEARFAAECLHISCTDEEAEERLFAIRAIRTKPHVFLPYMKNGRLRYYVLGILLLVLSLVWKHKIYYRMLATACFAIPVITGFFHRQRGGVNFGNFLDNRGN